jgi:thiol-disulfide isomerase/thioredoxin
MTRHSAPWLPLLALLTVAGCANRAADESAAVAADPADASAADSAAANSGYAPAVVPIGAEEILARATDGRGATLVNLWATWCAPCRHEMPALLSVARAHKADGLRLMLVSTDFDDQIPAVRRFLAKHGVDDTTYLKTGDDNAFINTIPRDWSGALPATLVFDKSGRLTDFWEGAADENRFEHAVIAALAETPQPEEPK